MTFIATCAVKNMCTHIHFNVTADDQQAAVKAATEAAKKQGWWLIAVDEKG